MCLERKYDQNINVPNNYAHTVDVWLLNKQSDPVTQIAVSCKGESMWLVYISNKNLLNTKVAFTSAAGTSYPKVSDTLYPTAGILGKMLGYI